jgi:hypothetical protein
MNTDTPLPQEEPAGQNPPDGAVIDYYLKENRQSVTLEIIDENYKIIETDIHTGSQYKRKSNIVIRKYSSFDTLYKIGNVNIPQYWIRPQQILSAETGSHRFTWDMHYAPLNIPPSFPIAATYANTAPNETSPWVLPGTYTARLTVDGKVYSQTFEVKMDPRVKTSTKDLQLQQYLSIMCYDNIQRCMKSMEGLDVNSDKAKDLSKYIGSFMAIQNVLQESDWPPTAQMINATKETDASFSKFLETLK